MVISLLITLILFVILDLLVTIQRQKSIKNLQEIIEHQKQVINELTIPGRLKGFEPSAFRLEE